MIAETVDITLSEIKALLKKAAARTMEDLWNAIANALPMINPEDCSNYFQAAGYGPV